MRDITLIAAVAENGVIGSHNALPWALPEDMAHFKKLTQGKTVLMGRKTWESLPAQFRPLPGRRNIVITRQRDYLAAGATCFFSVENALSENPHQTIFIIGGGEIYRAAMPDATEMALTEIAFSPEGDTIFPAFDRKNWEEITRENHQNAAGLAYAFVRYRRRDS